MSENSLPRDGITRRDFVGGALIGAGAALLSARSPAEARKLGAAWNGYAGVGDYAVSNGTTAEVMGSAHKIRDHAYDGDLPDVVDTREEYDVVIVGGGFSGLAALYELRKLRGQSTALLLDNYPIFGGFAKSNEFAVDGYRIAGPQASINFFLPNGPGALPDVVAEYWDALGIPWSFDFMEPSGASPGMVFPKATSGPLYYGEQCGSFGYYFDNALTQGKGVWVKDIWANDLKHAPMPEPLKRGLLALRDRRLQVKPQEDQDAWLDRISFAELVTREMGLSPDVLSYMAPIMGTSGPSPQSSAYVWRGFPGVGRFAEGSQGSEIAKRWVSFPGGNAVLLRHFVKALFPDAIRGPRSFEAIATGSVNPAALDQGGKKLRMRLSATAIRVSHEGDPRVAERVAIVYEKGGRLYRVRAKSAVLAIGSWVSKHIVRDLPESHQSAARQFLYSPTLMVNVALRNWRFLDKLGISTARWFDGFGFYATIRQPMVIGPRAAPFHPDKPIVMTFYVPIQRTDLPLEAQGPAGRAQLYGTSYAEYEQRITAQMQKMFAAGGFDARRDVAGIVLNRWGHSLMSPPPGFYFGKDGKPAPREVFRQRFGRISFGNSELGNIRWEGATIEGKRALTQILETL
ncbi:MAG TPA: NAD(P)-binding protein [Steroidobacteraceae bacterium]|nr:NAD(P)-binding protein [Steroidobacteraceae bacterium]